MSTNRLARTFTLLGVLLTARASVAEGLTVIANASIRVTEISGDDLRAIFLANKTSLQDGHRVQPVLHKPGPEMAKFSSDYLGKTESALRTYYRSLVFTGKWSMPVALGSDAEVVAYVAATRGAIGFVREAPAVPGVKALKVK